MKEKKRKKTQANFFLDFVEISAGLLVWLMVWIREQDYQLVKSDQTISENDTEGLVPSLEGRLWKVA